MSNYTSLPQNIATCLDAQTYLGSANEYGNGSLNIDVGGAVTACSSIAINVLLPFLIVWSPDVTPSVFLFFSQAIPVLVATLSSIHSDNLSLFDAHFAAAVTASPIAIYIVASSLRYPFCGNIRKNHFDPRLRWQFGVKMMPCQRPPGIPWAVGPNGFAAYLIEGREHHQGVKPFKIPTAYTIRKRPERKVSDKVPQSLVPSKSALERKAQGNTWLWDACNEAIHIWGRGDENWKLPPPAKRAKYFQAAIRDLPNYPPRALEPPQLSPALQALKDVLADAPVKNSNGVPVDHIENARRDEVSPAEVYYYWSEGYFTRVYLALHNVVVMNGVGPFGWEVARWMIYDEYSKWSGIVVDEKECKAWDNAYGWLQGRLPDNEELQLEFSAFEDQNSPPLTWSFINAALPVVAY